MHAWPNVDVPHLSVQAPAPEIFDSASQGMVKLPTGQRTTIYVCGITPYDATHMGHAATYVAFDTLIRFWRASGAQVDYAQNITDVDDPLIERALATGKNWQDIASEQTELFRTDMTALRVIPPAHYIGAVESIPLVIERIQQLQQADAVYSLDTDLYYPVTKATTVGHIAHLSKTEMETIFAQRGGDPTRPGKQDPLDALLWRGQQPNDPWWESPFGNGRPGWHIECAAIALEYLGAQIDVQGGGSDLKFPHHEMSAAHAESATGAAPFARAYMHTGMVALNGEKMSKSLGNLIFVSKLRNQGIDPMAIRLTILSHHYREDWEWFDSSLADNVERLAIWRTAFQSHHPAPDISAEIVTALANDLDTPAAIALIDDWATRTIAHEHPESTSHIVAHTVDALLGVV